jgi:hypothetical protein
LEGEDGNEMKTIQGSAYPCGEGFVIGNNEERKPPCTADSTGIDTPSLIRLDRGYV